MADIPEDDLEETRAALAPTLEATAAILPWVAKPKALRFDVKLNERWIEAGKRLAQSWSERHHAGSDDIRPAIFNVYAIALETADSDCLRLGEALACAADRLEETTPGSRLIAALSGAIECLNEPGGLEHEAFGERARHFAGRLEATANAGENPDRSTILDHLFVNEAREAIELMHEALAALRVSLRQHQDGGAGAAQPGHSPIVAGSLYEGLASQALLEHALDRQGAWGIAGWPAEEILHAYRFRQIQPSQRLLRALVKAIEMDESLESLEHRMGDEPLLTYRFLRYANSAHLGARSEVTSVRQGLMVMGYTRLRSWLMEQIPHASSDPNLDPIRFAMVLRARIMERLADAGVEDDLRREVFLCGIFSQLDLLLGEPLGMAIHRLPMPGRIASAVVGQTGPYAPWLEVAAALESGNTRMIRDVCKAHKMPADEVNRALLRTLASV